MYAKPYALNLGNLFISMTSAPVTLDDESGEIVSNFYDVLLEERVRHV